MRTLEPDFVTEWRKFTPVPKCCHTCDNYDNDGKCWQHQTEPPAEFTIMVNACPDWTEEIPF